MHDIPVYRPSLDGNERRYVEECLDSTWISSKGRFLETFERSFAAYTGNRHAAAVCNGTVALHVALVALGVGHGDEVIVPTLTYIAPVNAIAHTGATPVFVDSLPDTWQMDADHVRRCVSPRTRAIMAVHLYGHPCDMDAIMTIAREHRLLVVEDCAEAFGARYRNAHVGTFGHVATHSFFGNKTITTGEGGMVVTDDDAVHDRIVHLKGQGLAKGREYWHDAIGYNYRMTNLCAAIGLAQLERADELLAKKRDIAAWYAEALRGAAVTLQGTSAEVSHSHWMCSLLVDAAEARDPLRAELLRGGIETRPAFQPVHTMPVYAGGADRHPVAEDIAARGITLPSWPGLTRLQVRSICDVIRAVVGTRGREGVS